jgi:hypothetical protein
LFAAGALWVVPGPKPHVFEGAVVGGLKRIFGFAPRCVLLREGYAEPALLETAGAKAPCSFAAVVHGLKAPFDSAPHGASLRAGCGFYRSRAC